MFSHQGELTNVSNLWQYAFFANEAEEFVAGPVANKVRTDAGEYELVLELPYIPQQRPATLVYRSEGFAVVAIAGIQSVGDGLQVYRGMLAPAAIPNFPGELNAAVRLWAESASVALTWLSEHNVGDVTFVGHSLGGPVAQVLAKIWRASQLSQRVQLLSFGSPKFADSLFLASGVAFPHVRVMAEGDFIPGLLPTPAQAPLFASLHTVGEVIRFGRLVHSGVGVILTRQRTFVPSQGYPTGASFLEFDVSAVVNQLASRGSDHSMDHYLRELSQFIGPTGPPPGPVPVPNTTLPVPASQNLTREEANRIALEHTDFAAYEARRRAALSNATPRIRRRRRGRIHEIRVNDVVVSTTDRKGLANRYAGALVTLQQLVRDNPQDFPYQNDLVKLITGENVG